LSNIQKNDKNASKDALKSRQNDEAKNYQKTSEKTKNPFRKPQSRAEWIGNGGFFGTASWMPILFVFLA
jgi:hypothetical protein